ncbi:MAG TPA: prenyltransferase/squalene oxidase repeat-containing protein [Planctomycetia bacterium]|nr:prenyltransferase/squalene oxidase repeat-containing protein [Planctomycetia bacterium]
MPPTLNEIRAAYEAAKERLLAEAGPAGHWAGELSNSALSTAVAVVALALVERRRPDPKLKSLAAGGIRYLVAAQNGDGGWGDTSKSFSNISTTMLAEAAFQVAGAGEAHPETVSRARSYIAAVGGVEAVRRRYGKDRTFSAPILTCGALAGTVAWSEAPRLPFELARLPHRFYAAAGLPVVSYALPALIAIGMTRHHHGKPANPITRILRDRSKTAALAKLETLQPSNGGFLEATPLTAFVTMSLAGMELADHPVAERGVRFLVDSVREDGGWPIDTNLATWVTTLAVNALGPDLPAARKPALRSWLVKQQYREVHPYTQAAPGGWAWTDLPGGVPDADDTSGALLALAELARDESPAAQREIGGAIAAGAKWLLDLQNRDGGIPTFCRGWGKLPFDRSSADITAHALVAFAAAQRIEGGIAPGEARRLKGAERRALEFLKRESRPDGSVLPLWFGNQHSPDDENALYGTAKAAGALAELGLDPEGNARRFAWIEANRNSDGGWGGRKGTVSTTEETALAVEALARAGRPASESRRRALESGARWLAERVRSGAWTEPAPIGFYFAKLWYFERLYPIIFTVSALRRALAVLPEGDSI